MKLSIDGKNYQVKWTHLKNKYPHIGTICSIINLDNNDITEGHSYVSEKDSYNYDKGRKVSLSRALSKLFSTEDSILVDLGIKDCRKEFWKEYFKMTHKDYMNELSK